MENFTEVYAWGGDHFGQLGLGEHRAGKTYCAPRCCSFNVIIRKVSCGEEHTAFITSNGNIYCMGNNSEGRLGISNTSIRNSNSPCLVEQLVDYTAVDIACGWGHTVAIIDNGSAFSWGVGEFGALGSGGVRTEWGPVQVGLARGVKAVSVSCGSRHTAIIADEYGRTGLYTWGAGEAGQLGTGQREKELVPVRVALEYVKQVSCGVFHTAVVNEQGQVYVMGGNSFGQLGIGNKKSAASPTLVRDLEGVFIEKVACGHHTAAVSQQGYLYIWGSGVFGEYLTPYRFSNVPPIKSVDIGGGFGVAIDIDSNVWVWGANSNGELGIGNYNSHASPVQLEALLGKRLKNIACGGNYTIALGSDQYSRTVSPYDGIQRPAELESINRSPSPYRSKFRHSIDEFETGFKSVISPNNANISHALDSLYDERNKIEGEYIKEKEIKSVLERELQAEKIRNRELETRNLERSTIERKNLDRINQLEREIEALNYRNRELDTQIKDKLSWEHKLQERAGHIERDLEAEKSRARELESQAFERGHWERRAKDYERLVDNKEREISVAYEQNSTLSAENARMKEEIENLRARVHDAGIRESRLNSDMEDLVSEIQRKKDQIEDAVAREREINYRLDNATQEIQGLYHEADELKGQNRLLQQHKASLDKDNARLKQDIYQKEQNYNDTISRLQKEKDELQYVYRQEIGDLRMQIQDRDAQLEKSQGEVQNQNYQRNKLQDQYDRLSEEYSNTKNSLQLALNAQKERASTLERELQSLNSNYRDSTDQLRNTEQQLARLREDHATTKESLQRSQYSLSQSEARVEDLYSQNQNLERLVSELKPEVQRLTHEFGNSQDQLIQFRRLIQELEDKNYAFVQENNAQKQEIHEIRMKNKELFEALEKELATRAKEYKERTLSVLNTPPPQRKELYSPMVKYETIQESKFMSPMNRNQLSASQYTKLSDAATRHMFSTQKESPLKNIRISSPSRASQSPERPRPFNHQRSASKETTFVDYRHDPNDFLSEMRAKLAGLQRSKLQLESRMHDFQRRMDESPYKEPYVQY